MANIPGAQYIARISEAGGIADLLSTLGNNASSILRPKTPVQGISGYVFSITETQSVDVASDITDHYVEDNTSMQDHIALKPEVVTVSGLVAELYSEPQNISGIVSPYIRALDPLSAYLPELSIAANAAYNEAARLEGVARKAAESSKSLAAVIARQSSDLQTRQAQAYDILFKLWKARTGDITVETPWGVFDNMAIMSIRPEQDETTRFISKFTVTLKRIRIAGTIAEEPGQLLGRADEMKAEVTENGDAPGVQKSFAKSIIDTFAPNLLK